MSADDDLPQVDGCPASSSCPPLPAIAVIGVIFCHCGHPGYPISYPGGKKL